MILCPERSLSEKHLAQPEELGGFPSLPAKPQPHQADLHWICFNTSCLHETQPVSEQKAAMTLLWESFLHYRQFLPPARSGPASMMQQQALAGVLSLAEWPILFSFVLETVSHPPYVCSWLLLQPPWVSRNLSMTPAFLK